MYQRKLIITKNLVGATQDESADSVSNILQNIYYETAQAESADSVSNILL